MGFLPLFFLIILAFVNPVILSEKHEEIKANPTSRSTIDVKGDPHNVVWVVQLSDLHFSVYHPERALQFSEFIGPALKMINPSLVLITGDLTDGKTLDHLKMRVDEAEWIEYDKVMKDVIARSGLPVECFYDLRGNHDKFGVPVVGGNSDFFTKYSINAGLNRSGEVFSVTLLSSGRKHLFVGFDSAMAIGLRGPTNLFGHPADQLLANLDAELSQWDSPHQEAVTKFSFGHFPLSFSSATSSRKSLKDIFLKHSISAYLCGHLHTKFGDNLKKHYQHPGHGLGALQGYFQLNSHQGVLERGNCSLGEEPNKEFWEWEMGDWRKNRKMRIVAVDDGHVSFLDIDYRSKAPSTIILPTFPLDSRTMQRASYLEGYLCKSVNQSSYERIRTLIFSEREIIFAIVKIYDTRSGNLNLVLESRMAKQPSNESRGDLYIVPWNWRAFVDPSPDRFWLQIEAVDNSGTFSFSQMRPFSINGQVSKIHWKWSEFLVMGCMWDLLYRPLLFSILGLLFSLLLIPKAFHIYSKRHHPYEKFRPILGSKTTRECIVTGPLWILMELSRTPSLWNSFMVYLLYLMFFPWFYGQVFSENYSMAYMSPKGWTVKISELDGWISNIGVPDVLVIVLPHLFYIVLPSILVAAALVAERERYRVHYMFLSGKKEEDGDTGFSRVSEVNYSGNYSDCCVSFCVWCGRWARKALLVVCLAIMWKHWKHCRAVTVAYEANPFLYTAPYCLPIPLLLAFAVYKTRGR
ncbi:putative metallophosphoesterase At3g03305 [Amborella trichopoda]|uniref:putative metallophosphoesterase At3g03305 n=1 Tax=Amborella trichopoda TaxID=13333 RepID=UPI0005D3CB55|nr:putative metallophosphoesterase At3g03305 [Amborella trichopoda]|eukprot:XP_011626136.1 putative metallophosphoesterase At3g03305 [Amborella trichopoda]